MKKLVSILFLLLSLNFVSAVDLGEALAELDSSLVILVVLFIITFSVSFLALKNVFKDNATMAGIVSGAVAFLAIYGMNKIQFDSEGFLSNIGISTSALALIIFLIIIGGIIFMFVQLKTKTFPILGAVLIALSIFVYAKTLLIFVGAVLIITWVIIKVATKNNPNSTPATTSSTSSSGH